MAKLGNIVSGSYVVLGLYLFNRSLKIIPMPDLIGSLDKWIFGLSGLLLLLGAYTFSIYNKHH